MRPLVVAQSHLRLVRADVLPADQAALPAATGSDQVEHVGHEWSHDPIFGTGGP